MFNLSLYRWLTGIPRSGLLSVLLLLLIFYSQRSNAQTYANTQTNQVNGLCVLCGVVNPNNAVDGSTSTYSSFAITAGLLGVSVEQTLIFPSATTGNGCDSLFIGVGSNNAIIDLNIFQGVTVQTYNGVVANPDLTVLTSSILQVRILDGESRIVVRLKPDDDFDRVKVTLNSQLVGLLDGFRVYFASYESALATPVVSPTDTTICSGESVTFNVTGPSGNTFFWYNEPTGGSLIAIGDNFTTGALTSDTTFYVEGNDGTCTSERVPVNVTVNAVLAPPTVSPTDTTICAGETVTFNATAPPGATFFWYTEATGGSLIAIGDNFTTGALTSDTTFYVESNDGTCTSDTRTEVEVTVNPSPDVPTVSPIDTTICPGQTVTFNATSPPGVVFFWFDAPTGGSMLNMGPSLTTGPLTTDTTFYVESVNGGCSSIRTPANVTVLSTPAIPTVAPTDTIICSGQTVTFSASAPSGVSFNWYNVASGGSPVATGSSFTTGALTTDTTFYAESNDGVCASSTRTQLDVTVLPTPDAPTVVPTDTTICSGQTVTFNASAPIGAIFFWYAEPAGGSAIAIGDNFTTGSLLTDTTFYVESNDGSCPSGTRTELEITVLPTPDEPTVTPADTTICSGQTVTFNASAPVGASFNWYTEASDGSPIATGNSFTTGALTTDTTFYAESNDGACFSSTRTQLDVTVLPTPAIPTVVPTDTTICAGQTVTFNASAPAGASFNWYTEAIGGSPVATGSSFTTGTLTTDTTFYAESNDGACASSTRTQLDVTVLPTPDEPTVIPTDTTICSGQTVTFNASAPVGAIFFWYTEPTGGSVIAIGDNFTTGSLISDTTFYVEANDGSCPSSTRTQLDITVLPTPDEPTVTPTDTTICAGQAVTFNATAPIGASFNWYTEPVEGSPIATGNSFTTGALTTDTTFYVESNDGTCSSGIRAQLNVTILPTPDAPTVTPTDTTICSGQTVTFNASAPAGASFNWYTEAIGGSPVATGSSFTTGALITDTTFYAESNDSACASGTRTQLEVTVLSTPDEPTVTPTDTTICSGQTVTFNATAPSGSTFFWYTEPTGGSAIAIGDNFTTGALTTDTTFYVESNDGSCPSGTRTELEVIVLPTPDEPTVTPTDTTICAGQTVTFNASAPAGASFNWYTEAIGGSPVATGSSFTTGALTTDTTFYAESNDGACASGTRTQLDVTVLPTPDEPTVTPTDTTICAGQTVTFNASAPAGASFNWYTEAIGGSPVATGSNFTTGVLTTDTTFYAESNDGACASGTRTQLDVTVLPTPDEPTVTPTDTTICAGQTVTFNASAPAGASFNWYTEAIGGSPVATGSSFTTGALTTDTTFYAESNDGVCASGTRTQLDVTVLPRPAAPTVTPTDTTICSGQTVTFNASAPSGASFSWFTSASGGSPVATGSSFTTPALTSNTTYYAESSDSSACESGTRTQLEVTVLPRPAAPTVTPTDTTICSGQTATFNASAPAGASFDWYTSASGGSPVATGSSFTTPALTSNTTYYAESSDSNACSSVTRTVLTVTVNPTPAAPTVTPASATICSGRTATFTSSVSGGSVNWYTTPTGGSAVHTGNSFTTPVLTSNTTYYVEAQLGSCASVTRTAVTVTVNPTPVAPTVAPAADTICSGQTTTLTVTSPPGTARWYIVPSGGTPLYTGTTYTTPVLTSNITFYADVIQGSCASARTPVSIQVRSVPATPTVSPASATICSGQTATFNMTAPAGSTGWWYTTPSGGSPVFTGNTFTTPALTSNTTYYVAANNGSCSSTNRRAVTVTVNPSPAAPTVTPSSASICSGQTATFTASGTGTFNWFTVASGGSSIFTGSTFTTPALTSNTTYYVGATSGSCTSATRTAVTVTVTAAPAAPTVTPPSASICSGQTTTFTASGTGTFNWYTVASGGTSVFTGSTYTTPALTSNTTYYVDAVSGSCTSATRTAVAVTVSPTPAAPTVTPSSASICSGQTATFTASGTGTFSWYTVASGGTAVFTGTTFTTPALTSNTTYYVGATSGSCTSATRTAVTVTVSPTPDAPTVTPSSASICSGQTATLTASGTGTFSWYLVASGGTPVFTGSTFTTPALTSNTTYYVGATSGSCTSATRTAVSVTVNTQPAAPTVTPSSATICSGQTATFTASGTGTFNWYTVASGGTSVFTGSTFTTPTLTSNTTYYVGATSGSCTSATRTAVTVTVTAAPAAPTVTPSSASICSGQTATFTASGTGTFNWFTVASGGSSIFTGSTFTTPALTSNTTYYVSATSGSCTSATRTAVSVTVNTQPAAPTVTPSSATICSGQTATFTASGTGTFRWFTVPSGGTAVFTGSTYTTPTLTSNTTYYVNATSGSCTSATRTAVSVTVNPAPAAPTVSPSSRTICSGTTATFTATAPGATITWYTVASGGTPIHTGNSFTSPALSSNITYYAEATSGSCSSPSRTAASVTVQVCPNAVTSFTLINATNNTDIATLYDGDILDLATLPAGINIRANVYDQVTTKSVVFTFSAHPGGRTENGAPFSLFGDNNGNYNSWCCANVGTYNLSATPYTGNNASGSAGNGQTIEFQIIDSRIPAIVSYTLVNAGTNADIGPLVNGQTLNLANLPSEISIRANANNVTNSVYFDFSDNNYDRIENEVPFSLFSDINGNYTPWCCPAPGTYVLKTTPFSELNATGISGSTSEITFYIVSSLRISNIETYPNPADNNIVINVSGDASAISQVIITDMSGKEYYSGSMPIESSRELNLSELRMSSGVYILRVISGDQIETRKIIKK